MQKRIGGRENQNQLGKVFENKWNHMMLNL
jgi:hypothetical protein